MRKVIEEIVVIVVFFVVYLAPDFIFRKPPGLFLFEVVEVTGICIVVQLVRLPLVQMEESYF